MHKGFFMKKFILLIVFIFLSNLFGSDYAPDWYPKKNSSVVYGYGDGDNLKDAKKIAYDEIKQKIYKSGRLDNFSSMVMDDLWIEKQEIFENRYYLKLAYDNDSVMEQLSDLIKKETFKVDDENNSYLLKTKLMDDLNQTFGYYPNISIDGKNLHFKDKTIIIKNNEFELFLAESIDENISLEIKDILIDKELYFIKLKIQEDGYVTLVQVSKSADVELLFKNEKLTLNKEVIYPNLKMSDGLSVELDEGIELDEIMSLVILCKEHKDFSRFNSIDVATESEEYIFGDLINKIDGCKFSAIKSLIKKKEQ
jgi:hypothetical protein